MCREEVGEGEGKEEGGGGGGGGGEALFSLCSSARLLLPFFPGTQQPTTHTTRTHNQEPKKNKGGDE